MITRALVAILFFLPMAFAQDVQISVEPERPTEGENFQLVFRIKADGVQEPFISFNPGSAEVLGKSNQGLAISTRLVNGRFTTTREVSVAYEMVAARAGKLTIRDIKIDMGGKEIRPKDVAVDVISKAEKSETKEVFVLAVPSKTSVYVGEGLNVDYYLYTRVPVVGHEIADFPKLNNFTKRFQNANEQPERVEYNGHLYTRSKKYAARLFSDRPGKAVIDPMRLKVQYSSADSNSPYTGFGFSMRQYKTATLSSRPVEIEVRPLPSTDVPMGFTGLVGKHEFKLTGTGRKYLVNEAIEIQLEASGEGALEAWDAPDIYGHANLEKFDTKADFEELDRSHARKKFDYTYLGRGPVDIKGHKLELATFNPQSGKYETTVLSVPDLVVEGTAMAGSSGPVSSSPSKRDTAPLELARRPPLARQSTELLAPLFDPLSPTIFTFGRLNVVLALALVVLGVWHFRTSGAPRDERLAKLKDLHRTIRQQGASYQDFFRFLVEAEAFTQGIDIDRAIDKLALPSASKTYFKKLVENLEKLGYHGQGRGKVPVDQKHWKEMYKAVAKKKEA